MNLAARAMIASARVATINHMPALIASYANVEGKNPPRFVFRIEIDDDGRIAATQTVVATEKLRAIRFDG
jgi:hypothetical protein